MTYLLLILVFPIFHFWVQELGIFDLKIEFYASKSPLGQPHMSGNLKFDQKLIKTCQILIKNRHILIKNRQILI